MSIRAIVFGVLVNIIILLALYAADANAGERELQCIAFGDKVYCILIDTGWEI